MPDSKDHLDDTALQSSSLFLLSQYPAMYRPFLANPCKRSYSRPYTPDLGICFEEHSPSNGFESRRFIFRSDVFLKQSMYSLSGTRWVLLGSGRVYRENCIVGKELIGSQINPQTMAA